MSYRKVINVPEGKDDASFVDILIFSEVPIAPLDATKCQRVPRAEGRQRTSVSEWLSNDTR